MRHWNLLIAAHAIAATFAVMVGAAVLRMRHKGNVAHRRLGRIWMATMYFVVVSSFGIKELRPGHFSWIHGLSVFTFVTLTIALWAARTGRRTRHRDSVIGTYLGLLGAGAAAMAFPVRLGPQLLVHRPLVFTAVVLAVAATTTAVVRLAKRPRRVATAQALAGQRPVRVLR
jgi:uncharacterized membrane protein